MSAGFNLLIVAQGGRLQYEALLFTASLAAHAPALLGRLYVAEPQPGLRWPTDPRIDAAGIRAALLDFGARIVPFSNHHFGATYPHGNKIEALAALPAGQPFLFLDTDTLVTGRLDQLPVDFTRPAASLRVGPTWPEPQPYHADRAAIWQSLYDRFGLDFAASLDPGRAEWDWRRYLYFNAGWFFGADPQIFHRRFTEYAVAIRDDPGPMLAAQSLDPWLDQVALPLVIHSLGGGRPGPELAGLDGDVTCHYRTLSLLYARESDRVVTIAETIARDPAIRRHLRDWEPARELIYRNQGARKLRLLFDRTDLPRDERQIRQRIRQAGLWLR